MLAEALLVKLQQHMAMAALLLRHFLEYLRRIRVAFRQILGEGHVDPAVLLLRGDRDCQHLSLGQIKRNSSSRHFPILE